MGGQFRIAASPPAPADTIDLRVPLFTPAGTYRVTVKPDASRRTLDVDVIVPEKIIAVPVVAGVAVIQIADLPLVSGTTKVMFDGAALVVSATAPPPPGQFYFVPVPPTNPPTIPTPKPDTILVAVPVPAPHGMRAVGIQLVPPDGPVLDVWLELP
jgi:hypothetical protein